MPNSPEAMQLGLHMSKTTEDVRHFVDSNKKESEASYYSSKQVAVIYLKSSSIMFHLQSNLVHK